MKSLEIVTEFILFLILILFIIFFGGFIFNNLLSFIISFLLFGVNYTIVLFHERSKDYEKNFPYKPYKVRKDILARVVTGLVAGFNYIFFIGNYDHKKYNTQVIYPETLECVFGNISQELIFFAYILLGVYLFNINNYYITFLSIPIITNIISITGKK